MENSDENKMDIQNEQESILKIKKEKEGAALSIEPRDFLSAKMIIDAFISTKGWARTTDILCGIHYVNCISVRSPENVERIADVEYLRYIVHNEFDIPFMDHRITDAGITFEFFERVEDRLIDVYNKYPDRMNLELQEKYRALFEKAYYFRIGIYFQRIIYDYLRRLVFARAKLAGAVSFASFQYYLDMRRAMVNEIV